MAEDGFTEEEWRVIVRAPAYVVSSEGRVKRIVQSIHKSKQPGLLKGSIPKSGYAVVALATEVGQRSLRINRIVCEAFHGPAPFEGAQAAHRDGDRLNNRAKNLYWATATQNNADKILHGTIARGDKNGARTKPESLPRGESHWTRRNPAKSKARALKMQRPHPTQAGERNHNAKLREDDVKAILAEPYVYGCVARLARQFNVSEGLIRSIKKGRAWKQVAR